ncbi:restriction endonuclease subunit S [Schwartzia succinivorans]|jgi:type I restriction enzyme S subunit|uniref:Type I restriction enzyme, S subunit n=1 Tax=Schwartzia succinivorans DSM 10502 TaxID=1123243 RepID=A0A1M4T4V6_9FIRM|nr:restriction endonuclease subunit S [Schwartzia succinivorans]SHE39563.1 type I restriction enzyme, S subunit [Schwartzia succinivorans DSM 10502]
MEIELKKLGKITTGNTPSKKDARYWDSTDICFVKPDGIADEGITLINDSSEYISENARGKARVVSKDAIFVTCIGSIGKVGIADYGDYAFNQQINVIESNEKVLPRYLAYNLLYSKPKLVAIANSPVVPIINKTQFGEFVVNIEEDKTKQAEIISVLDKLTGVIDSRRKELEYFDELIKARFVEFFGDLMKNPLGWPVVTIADVSTFLKSGLSRKLSDDDIGLPVIRSGNIRDGLFIFDDVKYWYIDDPQGANTKDYILDDGDVLVNFINSASQIGKTAIYRDIGRDCIYTTNIFRMKLADNCDEYYYNWFAMSDYYYRHLQNIIQPAVNQASFTTVNFLKLPIPLPSKEKQGEFADFVKQVDKSKVVVQKALDETQKLFDSLMQEYFA